MKKVLLVAAMVALAGCDNSGTIWTNKTDRSLVNYHCDDEQMVAMEKSYAICRDSSYLNSFCFKQAKMSQCSYIGIDEMVEIGKGE